MTSAEFLAWEALQETKWEFDGVRPVAMVGVTIEHDAIQGNLSALLRAGLQGGPCRFAGPEVRVPTGAGRYRYPDGVVTCTPVPRGGREIAEAVVVFEILSESTSRIDSSAKLAEYTGMPSLQQYVMLEQDQVAATVITRTGTGWSIARIRGGEMLAMPAMSLTIALDQLYAGLAFEV